MPQIDYETYRRDRRLGYSIDNILVGCEMLLEELNSGRYDPDRSAPIAFAIHRLHQIKDDAKMVEAKLKTIGNIYAPAIPRVETATPVTWPESRSKE